jgi:energy-coupling factor transport system permease protein
LPPEIKIISYILFIAAIFIVQDFTVYLFILFVLFIFLVRIPWRSLKRGWIPISLLIFFTFFSNVLFQSGKILYQAGPFAITEEGINIALIRTMRLFFMIAGAKILTATTTVESLVGACGRMLKPLERLGVPVVEFFSTAGLTMKSLPRLKDHLIDTYKQKVKENSIQGFWGRIKIASLFLLPLIAKSLRSPEIFFEEDGTTE